MRAVLHVCRSFILARSPLSCSDSLRVLFSLQSPTTRFLLLCRVATAIATGEAGVNLERLVARAMEVDPKIEKKAKENADKIVKALKADTWTTCDGKVTFSGTVEVI